MHYETIYCSSQSLLRWMQRHWGSLYSSTMACMPLTYDSGTRVSGAKKIGGDSGGVKVH